MFFSLFGKLAAWWRQDNNDSAVVVDTAKLSSLAPKTQKF